MTAEAWAWAALLGLGAFHGLNPGMGWLFAVALGLQERSRAAVVRALPPIAVGHAAAILATLAVVRLLQVAVPPRALALAGGAALIGFGGWLLLARRHPRWVGMRVGARLLVLWSFVMASGHGAGLMLVPVVLADGADHAHAHDGHAVQHAAAGTADLLAVTAVHTLAMLVVMAVVAVVVYHTVGLALLRRAWVNFDLVWAAALILAGVVLLVP